MNEHTKLYIQMFIGAVVVTAFVSLVSVSLYVLLAPLLDLIWS